MNRKMNFLAISLGLGFFITALFSACRLAPSLHNPERTYKENVIVERIYDKGNYNILLEPAGKWKIFHGPSYEKIDWTKFSMVDGEQFQFPAPSDRNRTFFGLVGPSGDTIIASERRIPMDGQPNFRDLGGLPTSDKRYVKWGMIYRSGKLSDLTREDLRYFSHLDIRSVVDLRNNLEIKEDPDRYPKDVKYYHYSLSDKEGEAYNRLRRMVMKEGYRRAKAKDLFVSVMESFADTLADDIKPVFDLMLSKEKTAPLVYHCSGGKDRTGYTTAMILLALGVDRKHIINDYLMSNYYRREANISGMRKARLVGLDSETLEYAFLVRQDYMDAVFKVIDDKYGGTDAYLETKFGLTPERRAELKKRYTEPYFNQKAKDDAELKLEAAKKGEE